MVCRMTFVASGRQGTTIRCYMTAVVLLILSGLLLVLFVSSKNSAPVIETQQQTLVYKQEELPSPVFTSNVSMSLFASDHSSVVVRPERVVTSADVSNVFVSILTVPKYHGHRFSYQLMTWVQTFNPAQVCV